ncbi:Protein of unknown function DUF650, N-terminal domain [Methanococcus maripaludis C5]|uniref:DNA repair protein n=1 Tax=Methanococcus maripaludis (strain C5 / ATCC BAA-1333) TaxID=402880 RepID=A4FXH8_METM5|nr:Nre family DNA repair protein [Methanococcus maripaludis]ABO34907.1 Protein of unknown function DUF650, N-terminal domain [Methanococcus maripaludis C5]
MELFRSKTCALCKGRKLLCGRPRCPILEKFRVAKAVESKINKKEIFGASPPSVFVGEFGYPNVRIGPMVPPVEGDTSFMDDPSRWDNISIPEIMEFRSMLVMGETNANVQVNKNSNLLNNIQELAMANKPVDSEIELKKAPKLELITGGFTPPVGPRESMLKFRLAENPKIPRKSDYIVNDELKANEGMISLYDSGFDEYYIIKLLSTGLLGINKKLVPTKWSITAAQDLLGKYVKKKIVENNQINDYEVYYKNFLGNRYAVLLIPDMYAFEMLEVWLKGSLFSGENYQILGDFEDITGMKGYADEITGAFYASRLSILEYLKKRKKQAKILVFREITPEYYAPVGVWQIRTGVKLAMENRLGKFNNLKSALEEIKKYLDVPMKDYETKSKILKSNQRQVTLDKFF